MATEFESLQHAGGATSVRRTQGMDQRRAASDALRLAELRESLRLTQQSMAQNLAVSQGRISKIEREKDLHLSTLENYVSALGGRLQIRAEFPDGSVFDLTQSEKGLTPLMQAREKARGEH